MHLIDPAKSPFDRILAADIRFGDPTPENDQIWRFSTTQGEPPAISVSTTYGLRASEMRIFPRFIFNKSPLSDPQSFSTQPLVDFYSTNLLSIEFSPILNLDAKLKVWVPNSQVIIGQISFKNTADRAINFGMEWVVQLSPLLKGSSMVAQTLGINTVLCGQSGNLFPVFFLTGGPEPNVSGYPGLIDHIQLTPGALRQFTWALATRESIDDSFLAARQSTAKELDAEQVAIEMKTRENSINFDFGDEYLNETTKMGEVKTSQAIIPPYGRFLFPTYTLKRDPDEGVIANSESKLFNPNWGLQTTLDVWSFSHYLLPTQPMLLRGIIQNFLDGQNEKGMVDCQTSWHIMQTGIAATPILAEIVCRLLPYLDDSEWLRQVYPAICRHFEYCLSAMTDEQPGSLAKWNHLIQTGLPISEHENNEAKDLEYSLMIRAAESPALAALLLNECECLLKIGKVIGDVSNHEFLEGVRERISQNLSCSWNENVSYYPFREPGSQNSRHGRTIRTVKQNGEFAISKSFSFASRIGISAQVDPVNRQSLECIFTGKNDKRSIKRVLTSYGFNWTLSSGIMITDDYFTSIEKIEVKGLKKGDQVTFLIPNDLIEDPLMVIPLWAGVPTLEQADRIVKKSILAEWINSLPSKESPLHTLPTHLRLMLIEGLIRYGFEDLAVGIFRTLYGFDLQFRNNKISSLFDLPPQTLLLNLSGIKKLSHTEIIQKNFNAYFPPVTVKYGQVSIFIDQSKCQVVLDGKDKLVIHQSGQHKIVIE